MQKLFRVVIVILLLVVGAAVIYSQAQIYMPPHVLHVSEMVRAIPMQHVVPVEAKGATPVSAPVSAGGAIGTDAQPVVVKMLPSADAESQAADHEKDRQIQQGIEHYAGRIAATLLAENFLQLFQAIIYFLTLIIIFMLMENVKKFADAASKSAEAARISAELAKSLVERKEKHRAHRKMPPHFYRKR